MAAPHSDPDDNPGTVLESVADIVRTLEEKGLGKAAYPVEKAPARAKPAPQSRPLSVSPTSPEQRAQYYRPLVRPPTPILTVLDDGLVDRGQEIRLRGEAFVIGRTDGDLVLPHDSAISGRHAKLTRIAAGGRFKWLLEDLGSANGTFVLVKSAVLAPDTVFSLGRRLFRVEEPGRIAGSQAVQPDGTRLVNAQDVIAGILPAMVEESNSPNRLRFEIRGAEVVIGNGSQGIDIAIEDPLVSTRHAVLKRQQNGQWVLESERTPSGVWVKISSIKLISPSSFQCGEQRFQFEIP